jgi:peptidoglycan hydrolase-like protein with peptidoglycan-binding domain
MPSNDRRLHGAVGGEDVQLLQTTLRGVGFDPGKVDGVYGPDTAAAVRRYQADRGLTDDGIVGPRTWERISAEEGAATQGRQLRGTIVGATSGDDVREVQEALQDAGFDPGRIDGVYGPDTEAAVLAFQRVHGLRRDGIVGPDTREALLGQRLRLSGTVAALLRDATGYVGPSELVNSILDRHPEYGGTLGGSTHLTPEPSEIHFSAIEWLTQVRALFDPGRAPELHGRLVVIGLSLLDTGVASRLGDGGILQPVIDELTEPLDTLLTPRGRELRHRLRGQGVSPEQRFSRLSPSSRNALSYADGLSKALGKDKVHMEHLLIGLNQKASGPLRRLLDQADVGEDFVAALMKDVDAALPDTVVASELTSLPQLSGHAAQAVDHAFRLADAVGSPLVRSRYLLHGALSVSGCGSVEALASRRVHAADIEGWNEPAGPAAPVRPPLLAGATADTVPEPGQGRVRAADRLGTAAEVEMLVSVLLARDTPLPLAVGLFGDWGSGKSFFMALMQERMAELAQLAASGRPEAEPFCREVRPIRFNAWHYVDTNLWASLAATLFDELARADAPDEAQVKLGQLDEAREKVESARAEREQLEREAQQLETAVSRPTTALRTSASVAIRAVRGDRKLRTKLRQAAAPEATEPATEPQAAAPETTEPATERLVAVLGEVESTSEKARTVWRLFEEELLHRRRWVTLVSLVVLVGIAVAVSVLAGWPPVVKAVTLAGGLAAGLTPALGGALRVLYLAREAREARELPLLEKRDELARARAAEDAAEREVAQRERELAELRDKGLQLQQFVRERAASSDYRDRLGVISKVRRDFEQLVALLPGSGQHAGAEQVAAVAAAVTRRVPGVERIVLFIDDLDRCPHRKVVEVLQAVHLLLAFKLFVVVVGVDSRWLQRSLQAHYRNLLEEPDSYLEKIFQIPFTLRRMTGLRYRELIDQLTPRLPVSGEPPHVTADGGGTSEPKPAPSVTVPARADDGKQETHDVDSNKTDGVKTDADDNPPAAEVAAPEPPPLPRPEALVITDAERRLLGRLGSIVPTPRAAKRLMNIYRMLRVSVPDDELKAFHPDGGGEYQAVVLLLGVLVGQPTQAEQIFKAVMASPDDADLWQVLACFPDVHEQLAPVRPHVRLGLAAPYRRWAPRVSRFSFRLAAVLPIDDQLTTEAEPPDTASPEVSQTVPKPADLL